METMTSQQTQSETCSRFFANLWLQWYEIFLPSDLIFFFALFPQHSYDAIFSFRYQKSLLSSSFILNIASFG